MENNLSAAPQEPSTVATNIILIFEHNGRHLNYWIMKKIIPMEQIIH